ncbi:DUF305 domain-containing protein [Phyllobacterium sp. LjRoot231]|uniref:CopM family metallochaperone n=1 Tax=Phyllobacterium sp. LjRoot231 TaxID=3342289 RepID=UPI003ECE0F3E
MKITYIHKAALVCALAFASPVLAQDHTTHKTKQHDMMAMPKGDQSASSKAFTEANAKMHKDMAIAFTGNTDKDFVSGMIAHHQGAIDMAKIELEYGKDPEIRKLAEAIIAAQENEIKQMKSWLAKNGG